MLCDDLERWDGGAEVRGEGIRVHTAESVHFTAETNTTLKSSYTPIFFFLSVGSKVGYTFSSYSLSINFTLRKNICKVTLTSTGIQSKPMFLFL